MAGIGPGPFCAMLLADLGADVVRVDRIRSRDRGVDFPPRFDLLNRGKRSVALDLKSEAERAAALRLVDRADDPDRGLPARRDGAAGLGPEACLALNPRLVFGRMTGWGQEGPLAGAAGHDINYIALAGALAGDRPPGRAARCSAQSGRRFRRRRALSRDRGCWRR